MKIVERNYCGDSIVKNWDPGTQMINLRKFWIIKLFEEM